MPGGEGAAVEPDASAPRRGRLPRAMSDRGRLARRHRRVGRNALIALAATGVLLGLAACGGTTAGEVDEAVATTSAGTGTTTFQERGVLPEIVAATDEVVAHLRREGAVPDREARERTSDEFEASKRLRFPPGGPECRIRDIAAGSARLVAFVQAAPIFEEVVTSPDETVAIALDLPNVDPASPASRRCADGVTEALADLGDPTALGAPGSPPPAERPSIETRGSGVTTTAGGLFTGALVENTGTSDLVGVEVGFDVLDADGEVIGSGSPVRLPVVPGGATAAAGGNVTERECGCDVDEVAGVRVRVRADADVDGAREPETASAAGAALVDGELVISGRIENPGARVLSDPIVSYVVRDSEGVVMSGNRSLLSGLEVPAEGSAPFTTTTPSSFRASLPRPAAQAVVAVIG